MSETNQGRQFTVKESTKAPEGLAFGAAVGGILGTLLFGLTSVGLLATPGAEIFASGQWISALAGFGFGALCGGVVGGLVGLGIPEHEAEFSGTELEKMGILFGIYSADTGRSAEALKVLQANGAAHVRAENVKTEDSNHAEAA